MCIGQFCSINIQIIRIKHTKQIMSYLSSQKPHPQFPNYLTYVQDKSKLSKIQESQSNSSEFSSQIPFQSSHQQPHSKFNAPELPQNAVKCDSSSNSNELNKSAEFNRRLYLLMKEQIEVAAANYRQKMSGQLRAQAQQIQRLSCQVINNAHIIGKQAQIIRKLTDNDAQSRTTRLDSTTVDCRDYNKVASKSPSKLSLTQKKIVNRPRQSPSPIKDSKADLDGKIQLLSRRLDEINTQLQQTALKNRQIFARVSSFDKQFSTNQWKKLEELKERLMSYCKKNEQKMTKFDEILSSRSAEKNEIMTHLVFLREEAEQIKQLIANISSREFVYDSYPLNILKEELKTLSKKVDEMGKPNNHEQSFTQIRTSQSQLNQLNHSHSLQYSQRLNGNATQGEALNRSQLSSLSHYAPKYLKAVEEDRVKRSNEWEPQDDDDSSFSSEQDGFFYPEVESEILISMDCKVERLEKIITKQYPRLPVRVEVDQTGYIKYSETGMYILDQNTDGFQLSNAEIQFLKSKGIITF